MAAARLLSASLDLAADQHEYRLVTMPISTLYSHFDLRFPFGLSEACT